MNFIDLTGKLNDSKEYQKIINILENKCIYIEIVIMNGSSSKLTNMFEKDIIKTEFVLKWWGTKVRKKCKLFQIKATKSLFNELRKYETFCKHFETTNGNYSETTYFGPDDIAFFDDKNKPLLYTTTHEGYIIVREDLNNKSYN